MRRLLRRWRENPQRHTAALKWHLVMWRRAGETFMAKGQNSTVFITVCLLCLVLLPSFQLFKSCHLVSAICLTPKSGWLRHNRATVLLSCAIYSLIMRNQQRNWHRGACTYTREAPPGPYGLSTGGCLTLVTLWHKKHRSWSLEAGRGSTPAFILVEME